MFSKKSKRKLYKLLSLFSLVRGYNILLLCIAQYLSAIFILADDKSLRSILLDPRLFMLVLASAVAIAGGYIINNFYDFEKDIINKPLTSMITRLVSQNTKLVGYFILNFLCIIIAGYISFKAILFFSAYIFGMWLYSHRIKRVAFLGNIISAGLAITPFFAVFLYYKNTEEIIFVYASLLYLLILLKEEIKDLTNIPGDLTHNYQTIPVKYGEKTAKMVISCTILLTLVSIVWLTIAFSSKSIIYYFGLVGVSLLILITLLWKYHEIMQYKLLLLLLKFLLVIGVFSVSLVEFQHL